MKVLTPKPLSSGPGGRVLLCKNILTPVEVIRFATDHDIRQIVQESNPLSDLEMRSSLVMLNAPELFFDYPMTTVLSPDETPSNESEKKANLLEVPFFRSDQKTEILGRIEEAVKKVSPRPSLVEDVRLVTDELFSNALYNAPFTSPKLIISRKEKITLDPAMAARFLVGADSERLVIVCEDPYGSLNLDMFIRHLQDCLVAGTAEMINVGEGGAGIGTYMIFETCVSLFCGVEKGRRTTFACVFPLKSAYRNQNDSPKNIHFIVR